MPAPVPDAGELGDRPTDASRIPTTGVPVGGILLALGSAPFVAGIASNALGLGEEGAPRLLCPFAELTALPCPLCGASRAFRLAMVGDPGFLRFNAFWVVAAALALLAGAVLVIRGRRRGSAVRMAWPTGAGAFGWPVAMLLVLLAGGWCVALANRDAIVG